MKKLLLLLLLLMCSSALWATVPSGSFSVTYTCTGSVGPFAFNFPISDPTALTVTENTIVLSPASYTIVPVNNNYNNGGSITLLSACTSGWQLILARNTPITQAISFYDNMPIPMKTFERGLDKVTEIEQELKAIITGGGGGGGATPCGTTGDVQLFSSLTAFGCDDGVFTYDVFTHTLTVGAPSAAGTIVATKEIDVTGAGTGEIDLGTDGTYAGILTLSNGSAAFHVTLGSASTANYTFKFPPTAGTNTWLLKTDGSGNTDWVAPGSGGVGTVTSIATTSPITGGTITTTGTIACATCVTGVSGTTNQIGSTGGTAPAISLDPQFTVNSYGACTNTADAFTVSPAATPTSLADGLTVVCRANAANTTTTPTLKVGALAAKTIVKSGTSGQAALVANDILANMDATFKYNATASTWELQNPQQLAAPFSGITSGTNSTATMTVGTGASITVSGTGVNNANQVNGATVPASAGVAGTNSSSQIVAATAHGVALPLTCADTSGSGTAQSCTTTPTFTPATGDCINYTTTTANTGTGLTINVNSTSARSVSKQQGSTTTLAPNDVLANKQIRACFDAANTWEIDTVGNTPAAGITSISLPTNIFGGATIPCTGPTCAFTFNTQSAGLLLGIPPVGTQNATLANPVSVNTGSGTVVTAVMPNAVSAHSHIIFVFFSSSSLDISTPTDVQGDTFSLIYSNSGSPTIYAVKDAIGGNVTVSANVTGGSCSGGTSCIGIALEGLGMDNTSTSDAHSTGLFTNCSSGNVVFNAITTATANDLIVAFAIDRNGGGGGTFSAGPGFIVNVPASGNSLEGAEYTTVGAAAAYTPVFTASACSGNSGAFNSFAVAFKAGTSAATSTPVVLPLAFANLQQVFPGLSSITPAPPSTGSTGIPVQTGTPINISNTTTALAGNDAASTLYVVPTLPTAGAAFRCWAYTGCHQTTSTATIVPKINFTDESNTAEVLTGSTATCTTLGTNSISSSEFVIRAKSATTIYAQTTLTNTPHVDESFGCEQLSTN